MNVTAGPGNILVVDDNPVSRRLLTLALQAQGHQVTSAAHGQEALELLRRNGHAACDIVLLDILMPEMDGYQTLAEIKADPGLSHLPVIMISALDELESVVRCIEIGATDYLPRPYEPALLRARIESSLERKRLRDRETLYLKGLEQELQIGRRIQASFLPAELPRLAGWEIAASLQPAGQVSGDFYDAFPLQGGRGLALVLGDVCDKGVGAALFMALFHTLIRALVEHTSWGDIDGPSAAAGDPLGIAHPADLLRATVTRINRYILSNHASSGIFATLFFAILDPATGSLAYVNAGQEPPLILARDGVRSRLDATGMAVGILPEAEYRSSQVFLRPGDLLLGFSDGLLDAQDPSGGRFGRVRLLEGIRPVPASAADLLSQIQGRLAAHVAEADPFDDITLLAVRRATS